MAAVRLPSSVSDPCPVLHTTVPFTAWPGSSKQGTPSQLAALLAQNARVGAPCASPSTCTVRIIVDILVKKLERFL